MTHESVMVDEVLEYLDLQPGQTVIDGTLGLAGHALHFVQRIQPDGTLIGFDWDTAMLSVGKQNLSDVKGVTLVFVNSDYREIPEWALENLKSGANGILLDMGLNNAQIEDASRGISFLREGPLDMRMDRTKGEPASAWLNRAQPHQIEKVLLELGGEHWAKRIALVIVDRRKQQPIHTTTDLVNCILAAVPKSKRDPSIHPATRTFQGIRAYINNELTNLEDCIVGVAGVLKPGGTLVCLAYHSGEDGPVKRAFKKLAKSKEFTELTPKPIRPSDQEVARNPKSRSAKLRAIRRVATAA